MSARSSGCAIIHAAGQGHTEVVGLLLDRGVPMDAAYEHQLTALMWLRVKALCPPCSCCWPGAGARICVMTVL